MIPVMGIINKILGKVRKSENKVEEETGSKEE